MNKKQKDSSTEQPLLSILMPTLDDRQHFYNHIAKKLSYQITKYGVDKVEFLSYKDNREKTTGHKRNVLLEKAKGRFVVCVDDDDDVAPNYVELICDAIIRYPQIDAIGICGLYTENGMNPTPFITGRQFNWDKIQGRYCRTINHISPIKAEIAKQFKFPDLTIGEDYDWTMQIKKSGLIQHDYIIQDQIYFYEYRPHK